MAGNPPLHTQFAEATGLLKGAGHVLLTMHERMDGDDGGSLLALAEQLERGGQRVTCAVKRGVPESLRFLPGSHRVVDGIDHGGFDLLVTFGCATKDRTGNEAITKLAVPTINVDHHPDNAFFGDVNVVDRTKSSVAEMVYDWFVWAGWPLTKTVATCLLTGMVTDTGSFMHSNTAPSTLKAAAHLMRRGALTHTVARHTFHGKGPEILKAWARAIENLYFDEQNRIIYAVISPEDLEDVGPLPQSAFDGLVETLNTIPEAKVAMLLRQDGEVVKGSLRSDTYKEVNVAKIAHLFGGGGHTLAAGFSVAGRLVRDERGAWQVAAR